MEGIDFLSAIDKKLNRERKRKEEHNRRQGSRKKERKKYNA